MTSGAASALSNVGGLVQAEKCKGPEDIVRVLADALLQGDLRPEARVRLVTVAADGPPSPKKLDQGARNVAHALMTMPEYQLA